jgi:D-aminoacyl-tRNA deacylase
MRAVVQRVTSAQVVVGDRVVGAIGTGLLVFVGVEHEDGAEDVQYIASKIRDLRIFADDGDEKHPSTPLRAGGKRMNRSVVDVGGAVLVVSQFTLAADVRRGRRPSFDAAAPPEMARERYEEVVRELRAAGLAVQTGEFQAMMRVRLENDGPVTILLDSRRRF